MQEKEPEFIINPELATQIARAERDKYLHLQHVAHTKEIYAEQLRTAIYSQPLDVQLMYFKSLECHLAVCEAICHKYAIGDTENP